jgi:DEAD/DEAH box helicase domain-containing protein
MIRGIWACSSTACDAVPSEFISAESASERRIGRLYGIPTARCRCGARVLELLYCYQCGDVSLGGFSTPADADHDPADEWYLSALARGAGAAERPVFRRAYGTEYMWYWPRRCPTDVRPWQHDLGGTAERYRFIPANYDPAAGFLSAAPSASDATGTMLSAPPRALTDARVPALPERCPRCDARPPNRDARLFHRGVVRSPIRAHTTGASRVGQIVVDRTVRLVGESAEDGRTIVFTDSRDDAANTAAGMELNHFRDLLRQLTTRTLSRASSPAELLRRAAAEESLDDEEQRIVATYQASNPSVWAAYMVCARMDDPTQRRWSSASRQSMEVRLGAWHGQRLPSA